MEELIYLLLMDMANAQLWADSNSEYLYLESAIKVEMVKSLMQYKPKQSEQNGRTIFLQLDARSEGENVWPLNLS